MQFADLVQLSLYGLWPAAALANVLHWGFRKDERWRYRERSGTLAELRELLWFAFGIWCVLDLCRLVPASVLGISVMSLFVIPPLALGPVISIAERRRQRALANAIARAQSSR